MLDLCYVHARSDSVRWRAAFEKCWVQTNFFGGGGGNNNPKTSLILWVEGKTCSPLARHPEVVGRCGYSCSSRSRFMKTKMHLAELDWKEQTEVCVLVSFLLRPVAMQNSICIFSHVQLLAVWVWSLKSKTIFILMHENLNFPNTWEKLWMCLEISYQLNSNLRGWGSIMSSFPLSYSQKSPCDASQKIWS